MADRNESEESMGISNTDYDGMMKFVLWDLDLIKNEFPPQDIVYHYTKPESFRNIIQSRQLRLTNVKDFEDKSEGKIIIPLFREICDELLDDGEINKEQHRLLSSIELDFKYAFFHFTGHINEYENYERVETPCDMHVCCFCKNENSDYMWKNYCEKDTESGYNICVDLELISKEIANPSFKCFVGSVCYDKDRMKDILKRYVRHVSGFGDNMVSFVKNMLNRLSLFIKSEEYSSEEEIRMVLAVPIDKETSLYKDQIGRIHIDLCCICHIVKSAGAMENEDTSDSVVKDIDVYCFDRDGNSQLLD